MARTNLGQLLGNLTEQTPPAPPPTVAAEPRVPPQVPRAAPTVQPPRKSTAAPGYLRFVRKDTRLREDQLAALTVQARRLNRARQDAGARITENSLIRIAIDLMLARIGKAAGSDEDAIRRSLE